MKTKLRDYSLWALVIGLVLGAVKQGAELFGYHLPDMMMEKAAELATTILLILGALGVVNDPPNQMKK